MLSWLGRATTIARCYWVLWFRARATASPVFLAYVLKRPELLAASGLITVFTIGVSYWMSTGRIYSRWTAAGCALKKLPLYSDTAVECLWLAVLVAVFSSISNSCCSFANFWCYCLVSTSIVKDRALSDCSMCLFWASLVILCTFLRWRPRLPL